MDHAIGLVELKSIAVGVNLADVMLKAGNVELMTSTAICPGKYVIIVNGNVGSVRNAMKAGEEAAKEYALSLFVIDNVHPTVAAAISGTSFVDKLESLGMIETMTSIASVRAGDIAAKTANIRLMEIRMARGLGGKGFTLFTGDVAAVRSAVKACTGSEELAGEIVATTVIPAPHKKLLEHIL